MRILSKLFELQPDPFDFSQRRFFRLSLYKDVKNAVELREALRCGSIDAALIRAELCLEVFMVLAAANRAVHQAAHNRLSTRSLHAELVYSLSPTRNIAESLLNFGISETSKNLLIGLFDDENGEKMKELSKKIDGKSVNLDDLPKFTNYDLIKKVYKVGDSEFNHETICDLIVMKIATKDSMN
ncbi:unnamed protein product [Dracunculus medinensis]|uniref:EKC/KEOPS complex subunit CGI121 n=1 Tax=Dracunculus medinensis TaxID=318479 RepID=A0A0N4U2G9_DRAME|nr:unnamed protein product [Dracunculus medinensis]